MFACLCSSTYILIRTIKFVYYWWIIFIYTFIYTLITIFWPCYYISIFCIFTILYTLIITSNFIISWRNLSSITIILCSTYFIITIILITYNVLIARLNTFIILISIICTIIVKYTILLIKTDIILIFFIVIKWNISLIFCSTNIYTLIALSIRSIWFSIFKKFFILYYISFFTCFLSHTYFTIKIVSCI